MSVNQTIRRRVFLPLTFLDSQAPVTTVRELCRLKGDALRFKKNGKADVQVKIASIHDLSLGDLSRQVGGVPLTLAKAALPYSGGRAVSLFTHKKYDTLTLEYVDAEGGLHGAIFELKKGQAEGLRNELLSKGAQVSNAGNELTKQTAEVSSENK